MRFSNTAMIAGAILTLAACATQQNNPYYAHSTKYQTNDNQSAQSAPATQSASYQAPITYDPQSQQARYEAPITHSQPSYVQPASAPYVTTSQVHTPAQTYAAEQSSVVMFETGGQNGGIAGQNLSPDNASDYAVANTTNASIAPAQTSYASAYINQPTAAPHQQAYTFQPAIQSDVIGIGYIVQESDTVYSLSRKTCNSVSEIAQMNNLPPSFLIKAGETLSLPASRC